MEFTQSFNNWGQNARAAECALIMHFSIHGICAQSMAAHTQFVAKNIAGCKITTWGQFFCVQSYQVPPSASPAGPSSPVAGPPAPSVSHPSLSPDPLCLSDISWRPLQPASSHTSRTGWRLSEGVEMGEQRSRVKCAEVVGRVWRRDALQYFCLKLCRVTGRKKWEPQQIFISHWNGNWIEISMTGSWC